MGAGQMDILTFITKSEWPLVVGGIGWFCRKYIRDIFQDLHLAKLKVAGMEAEFARRVGVVEAFERVSTLSDKDHVDVSAKAHKDNTHKKEFLNTNTDEEKLTEAIENKQVGDRSISEELQDINVNFENILFFEKVLSGNRSKDFSPNTTIFMAFKVLEDAVISLVRDPTSEHYMPYRGSDILGYITASGVSYKDYSVARNLKKLKDAVLDGSLSATDESAKRYAQTVYRILPRILSGLCTHPVVIQPKPPSFEELDQIK